MANGVEKEMCMKEEDKRSSNDVSLYNTFQNSGHLQAKWGKGLGKTETSFMGGEPFQGVGSEDRVEVVLDVGDTVITMAFDRLGRRVDYQETPLAAAWTIKRRKMIRSLRTSVLSMTTFSVSSG